MNAREAALVAETLLLHAEGATQMAALINSVIDRLVALELRVKLLEAEAPEVMQ
jgi:hypothetical protein